MNVNIHKLAKLLEPSVFSIKPESRLPPFIAKSDTFNCQLVISDEKEYYLADFTMQGDVVVVCQRCMGAFPHHVDLSISFAICRNEDLIERLQHDNDCILSDKGMIDLETIVVDNLFLYCPEKHNNIADCDSNIVHFIDGINHDN